ncbi:MAG: nucleoside triphosphate pyrophosphohydrolase [Deltaproteobacteria bacterium]|nr:MAG: nucleoside triphosphate pyrophosphohydrolase [Deltaproteobacteria bacterium]RLB77558.1 MAG: nucleoside triphosphate pyrophosphohydrolase [Deltaproteobacteria bacterium]
MAEQNIPSEILNLVKIMATLRSPAGCPWDKIQTPETLKPYILEEAYELIEAIDNNDSVEICSELGDLLLQVVFIAQIFSEQNKFDLAEVAHSICNKLTRRHPHVFADASADEHAQRWEEIKQQERLERGKSNKLEDRIPSNLPALKKATKVAKKLELEKPATHISNIQRSSSSLSKLIEEPPTNKKQYEIALGNLLFNTVQLSHSLHIDAEDLLRKKTMQVMKEIGS